MELAARLGVGAPPKSNSVCQTAARPELPRVGPRFASGQALRVTQGATVPAPETPPIEVSAEQNPDLKRLVGAHFTSQKLAGRARVILRASEGRGVSETAGEFAIWRKMGGPPAQLADSGHRPWRAVERCPALRRAGHLHAGADRLDHGAGLRRFRTAGCADQPVEPGRTGALGGEPEHRQHYLARATVAF